MGFARISRRPAAPCTEPGSGEPWSPRPSGRPPRRSSFEYLRIPPPLPPILTSGQAVPPSASFLRPAAPPLPTLLLFGAVRSGVFNNSTWEVSPRKCLVINFTQQEVRSGSDVRKPPSPMASSEAPGYRGAGLWGPQS